MVEKQLCSRGITDKRVLDAMGTVPRERFVQESYRIRAYDDCPLPIGEGQTISQPYMVAVMTQLLELKGTEKVLEIGTGCGYQSAILASLCERVFTIERIKKLGWAAERLLPELGFYNVLVRVGDGTHGWPEQGPFDAIIVTAGSPEIPQTLIDQLADKGRLVIPVGDPNTQTLCRMRKRLDRTKIEYHEACRFVRLIGRFGWKE